MFSMKLKLTSYIKILCLFIPWIIYWLLSIKRGLLGILLGLVISIVIFVSEFAEARENFMAAVTLAYFIMASIAIFIFHERVFIIGSVFLGNFTLLIMSSLSLLFKYPYTCQIVGRICPESVLRSRSFIKVNMTATAIWSLIYLFNALISLLPDVLFKVVVPIMLVFLGIYVSIIFPGRLMKYLESIGLPRYGDWRVVVDKNQQKGEDEFDVIVVGSGIGGLTVGALLARDGFKVLVLEQYSNIGGYCQSFRRGGFIFDAGVMSMSGFGERGAIRYLLNRLGLWDEKKFVKTCFEYILGSRRVKVRDLEDLRSSLIKEFPEEKDKIDLFLNEIRSVYNEMYSTVDRYVVPLPSKLAFQVFGVDFLKNYHELHPHHSKWMNRSFKEILDEFFENNELKVFLSSLTSHTGVPSERASVSMMAALFGYYFDGGFYPKGGSQQLANILADVIRENGGVILLRHYVDKIIVEDNEVRGVIVGEKTFRAPIVIYNGNVKNLFRLVDVNLFSKEFVDEVERLKPSVTAFTVYLGVDLDLGNYSPIIWDLNENICIFINSNLDSSLAPPGKSSVTILSLLPPELYNEFKEMRGWRYRVKKWEFADKLIEKAEKIIPNLRDSILIKDAATPKTFERCTLNWMGSIYAFEQAIDSPKRPYFKTPIKGLYLVGASTFPGAGIEAVVISGIICFHDIREWK